MFVAGFITKLSQNQFKKQSKTQGEISSYIEEYIGQQKVVKAFGYEDLQRCIKKGIIQILDDATIADMKAKRLRNKLCDKD